ncbi:hypothetical protein J1N35_009987 [Gossypium stocksii]|uniref:Uncharacterized protein n=1 Tax=Gossypium stocksii TaxID=47602 RepID=A0A9D3VZJ4_9ROSI|nr:hypothetical protein J1N35_009987 [Gossypium stocksii]
MLELVNFNLEEGYEREFYESEFGNRHGHMRILNYKPADQHMIWNKRKIEGVGMHIDMNSITTLYHDELGGVPNEIKGMEQWEFKIITTPGFFEANLQKVRAGGDTDPPNLGSNKAKVQQYFRWKRINLLVSGTL